MKYLLITVCWILSALGQDISIQKCQEYGKAVFKEEDRMFSWRSQQKAKRISTCTAFDNPLIVGGTKAKVKEFPHMALLGYGPTEGIRWLCAGSLISEKHVLTAGHCNTHPTIGPPQKVRLGMIDIKEKYDYVQEIIIENVLMHPDYKPLIKYHDIAVIFLKQNVVFSEFVRPACLNTVKVQDNTTVEATGFGRRAKTDRSGSKQLEKVTLHIISNEKCNNLLRFREFEMPRNIIDEMLCAGELQGGKDTCQGDSGGPLQVFLDEPYCMYSIIGVTSFGDGCGLAYSPGMYTNVESYVPWIESTIWPITTNISHKMAE